MQSKSSTSMLIEDRSQDNPSRKPARQVDDRESDMMCQQAGKLGLPFGLIRHHRVYQLGKTPFTLDSLRKESASHGT